MRISFMADTFVKKFDRKCRMVMMAIRGISFSLARVLGSPGPAVWALR